MSGERTWPKPSLTADVLPFTLLDGALAVLLIRRGREPFEGRWALPGGFCEEGETIARAAQRELEEETGVAGLPVEELATMSTPGRDPRGWIVGVAHLAFLPPARAGEARSGDDASDAAFFTIRREGGRLVLARADGGPADRERIDALAFDHDEELGLALARLREDPARFAPALLGETFSREAFARACDALALEPRERLARALEDGHVVEAAGGLRAGPTAFPARSRRA